MKYIKSIHINKRLVIIFVIVLVLPVIALMVITIQKQSHNDKIDTQMAEFAEQSDKTNQAINLAINGDVESAITLAKYDVANASTYQQQIEAYNKLANVYLYLKMYNDATLTANKAIAVIDNGQSWVIIGKVAEQKGDYKVAVDAYQHAVALSIDSKDDARGDYVTYSMYLNSVKEKL